MPRRLTRADVVVRWTRIAGGPTDDGLLDARARARCSRFYDDDDRRRFVAARMLARLVVADVTASREADVALRQRCIRCGGPHGRPEVTVAGRRGPAVSLAHAGDLAIVAVARRSVGVDVEPADATDDTRRWVRGEAVLKMTGHGLAVPPRVLDITPSDEEPAVTAWRGPGRMPHVQLCDLELCTGYVAALARAGRGAMRVDVDALELSRS